MSLLRVDTDNQCAPCDLWCEYPAGRMRAWIFWALPALFFLYEFMLRVSPSVIEQELQESFHADGASFGFSMGMYYYAYAPMQLVVGVILDRWGSRRPLAIAAIICAAGAALFATADSLGGLGAGRVLAGMGSAFAYVGTIYVATVWFPGCRIALLAGVTAALGMLGAVAGESVLGFVDEYAGWRTVTWWFCGVAVLLGVLIWVIVPRRPLWIEHSIRAERVEHGGHVFAGLITVLKSSLTWRLALVTAALYLPAGTFGAMWGERFLSDCLAMGPHAAGGADAMLWVGLGVAALTMGWLSDMWGRRKWALVLGTCLCLVGTVGLLLLTPGTAGLSWVMLLLVGLGVGGVVVAFPMGMDLNGHHARGGAITFINFFQMLLAGLGQWIIGLLLSTVSDGSGSYSLLDFRLVLLVLPVALVAALVLLIWIPDVKPASCTVKH